MSFDPVHVISSRLYQPRVGSLVALFLAPSLPCHLSCPASRSDQFNDRIIYLILCSLDSQVKRRINELPLTYINFFSCQRKHTHSASPHSRQRIVVFRALSAFRKQFAELYLAAKKQLHYHELRRSKYPNFCDHTIKEPHISLTRRGKLNFLLQAFQKITSNAASCTRKSFFLSSSHAPPHRLPSCLPRPSAPHPGPPCLRHGQREERKMDSTIYEISRRKLHVRLQPEVGLRRCAGTVIAH